MDSRTTRPQESPAADAAGLLLRIGFGLLVLVAPVAALFSRRAFVVLVPIGGLLIVVASLVKDSGALTSRARAMLTSTAGLCLIACALWALLSLAWTPFPGPAAERMFRTLGIGFMAALVVAALPARMRASNLHLMTIGIAVATLALIIASVLGPAALRFMRDSEAPTTGRAAIAASVMVWPAVAWTLMRGRDGQAYALIAAAGLAIAASGSIGAATVMVFALIAFLAARSLPQITATVLAVAFALLIALGPALAFVARAVARGFAARPDSDLSLIGLWADAIASAPSRLITGHGFDTALRARLSGFVNSQAPGGLVPDLWFDLGLVGALGFAVVFFLGFRAMGRMSQPLAATSLAASTATILFAIIDPTSTQAWWLSVVAVAAVTLGAVHNGQYRTVRPAAGVGAPGENALQRPQARIAR